MQKTKSKITDIDPTISITTLNINALNNPIKRQVIRLDKNNKKIRYNYMLFKRHTFHFNFY